MDPPSPSPSPAPLHIGLAVVAVLVAWLALGGTVAPTVDAPGAAASQAVEEGGPSGSFLPVLVAIVVWRLLSR